MVLFFANFFQFFGLLSFVGCIVLLILIKKELKKQLPTVEEREEMTRKGLITGHEKKKVLREKTMKFRYQKRFDIELKKALANRPK